METMGPEGSPGWTPADSGGLWLEGFARDAAPVQRLYSGWGYGVMQIQWRDGVNPNIVVGQPAPGAGTSTLSAGLPKHRPDLPKLASPEFSGSPAGYLQHLVHP